MGAPLEWQFEVGSKIDGLTKMLEALDESVLKLGAVDKATTKTDASLDKAAIAMNRAAAAMEKVGHKSGEAAGHHDKHAHSLINLGHQFEYAKNGVNEFAEAIGLVLVWEGIEKLVDKVKELGGEILHAGAEAQQAHVAFDILFGKAEADEYLEYLERIAGKTPQQLAVIKGAWATLGRGGFKGEDLARALAAGGDIAARSTGDQAAALQEALTKFNMVKSSGVIQPKRFFKTIGLGEEDAPDKFFQILSKRTGKGVEQLKKDVEAGKVATDDILESIYWMIAKKGGKLGEAWLTMGKTMGSKITHFKEIPDLLFEQVEKSPAFDRFSKFLGDMTEKLGPSGPLGSKLAEGLGRGFDVITDKLSKIDAKDIEGFIEALAALPGVIADLTKALVQLLPVASKVAGVAAQAMDTSDKPSWGKALLGAAPGIGQAYTGWRLWKRFTGDKTDGKPPPELAHKAAQGLEGTMLEDLPKVYRVGAKLGDAAVEGAKGPKGIDAHSPSKKFARLGRMSVDGYSQGVDEQADSAVAVAARAVTPDAILPAGRAGGGSAGRSGSGVNISLSITVNANGSAGASAQEIGQEVRSGMEEILPGMLEAAFDKMRLEAGV